MTKISKKIIEPPTITNRLKGNYQEVTDESPPRPLQNNPVMPLASQRPPVGSKGGYSATQYQVFPRARQNKPSIAGDLPKEQIKEPESEKEIANSGRTIGWMTTWDPFAIFGRDKKKVGGKESQEAENIATNLKTLQASLAILLTYPDLKKQEIRQLQLQINKVMKALPETERPAAWQRCLEQVINSEPLKRFDTADDIQAFGQAIHQDGEANKHPTTCRGLALAIIAGLIFKLHMVDRPEAWGRIKKLLADTNNRLTDADIQSVLSV